MSYFVVIEEMRVVEVNAPSEEKAIEQIRNQILQQDPRSTAKFSIAKEVEI